MNQFTFTAGQKKFTFGLMAIGLISMILCYIMEPGRYPKEMPSEYLHTQFWTNFLHNSYFFTGIAFSALLFIATHSLGYGGWHTTFKRVPEAIMMFLPVGVVLMLIVWGSTALGLHKIYMWNDAEMLAKDPIAIHKSSFLNLTAYFIGILIIAMWGFFAYKLRSLSIEEDSKGFAYNLKKSKFWSGVFLPLAGFSSAFVIWQVAMSIDIHWYSTMFAWYSTASFFVACICVMILIILFLKQLGYLPNVTVEHFHDLGKFAFGISVFWTYVWFSQFMLIWYANNGEETQYFFFRFEQFKPLFFVNLLLNFILPFLILIRNTSKRILGTLGFVAMIIVLGHWIDFYQQIKPSTWYNFTHAYEHAVGHHETTTPGGEHHEGTTTGHGEKQHGSIETPGSTEGHVVLTSNEEPAPNHGGGHHEDSGLKSFYLGIHAPGPIELGTFAGFLGLFLFVVFTYLSKASLEPKGDAYYEESEHHAVM